MNDMLRKEAEAFAAETAWVETWNGCKETIPGYDDLVRELAGDTAEIHGRQVTVL